MLIMYTSDPNFERSFKQLRRKQTAVPPKIRQTTESIFKNVGRGGDKSLFLYTRKFDRHNITARTIKVSEKEIEEAESLVPAEDIKTLKTAAVRIRKFHELQMTRGFSLKPGEGETLEQRLVPLKRVGVYIPAGTAPLVSTVFMTAIPAKIAGVDEIAMVSPWLDGKVSPHILAAARMAGVSEIYKVGGAQGIAALALGTGSIPAVEKIVGPGNIWVNTAKLIAFQRGLVDIDTLAGPSEIVVLSDGSVPAAFAAADLLSQVEHGVDSMAILVTTSKAYANGIIENLRRQSKALSRMTTLEIEFHRSMRIIVCKDLAQAGDIVNRIAPEHLEIHTEAPRKVLKKIRNAASIFLGPWSSVALGDYLAGPNHVLPTAARARFASPLGVEDFLKRQSVTCFSRNALRRLAPHTERFALLEGLDAHARAVAIRRMNSAAADKSRGKRK